MGLVKIRAGYFPALRRCVGLTRQHLFPFGHGDGCRSGATGGVLGRHGFRRAVAVESGNGSAEFSDCEPAAATAN
jgi:hypothetical protein